MSIDNMISIYIHIPFCVRKCKYCDFLSFKTTEDTMEAYVEALCREIELYDLKDKEAYSIFIGGGTPSLISAEQMERILLKIKCKFNISPNCEISMECNPGTVDAKKLARFRKTGINRLSIGVQSTDDNELKTLGRIHNYEDFLKTYQAARDAGFENINVDLISAIPGQTVDSYEKTLTNIVNIHPEHISAYSLIIEENTEFWDIYCGDKSVSYALDGAENRSYANSGECCTCNDVGELGRNVPRLPDEDDEREMYYLTKKILGDAGYHRYEISNYALDGYECRHNKVYWTGQDYVSFGIGAASYIDGLRYNNISDINEYIEYWTNCKQGVLEDFVRSNTNTVIDTVNVGNELMDDYRTVTHNYAETEKGINYPYTDVTPLTTEDMMEEYMYVGLRLCDGISINGFCDRFGVTMDEIYDEKIDTLISQGLMDKNGDKLKLTDYGIDVSNYVLARFLL